MQRHLRRGDNVLAVEAENVSGPAGVLARLGYAPDGETVVTLLSDQSWLSSRTHEVGWQKADYDDRHWQPVRVLGLHGEVQPWKDLAWDGGRFSVPPGFRVEPALGDGGNGARLSLLNLTFDNRGRLLISQENGYILLCAAPNAEGVYTKIRVYCTQIQGCQGMCWVGDSLLLAGQGPQGPGVYRCRDTKNADQIDEVELLHRVEGGLNEHGVHALLHVPDDHLYVVFGNAAWARPDRLADNSPLRRWPNGQMGAAEGEPGSTEDLLLPTVLDPRGHASDLHSPGGTVWRFDTDGRNPALVTAGLRNTYDAAFNHQGELFTFDSDWEGDIGLPWYRPVRLCFCPPGADFLWRSGSGNTPSYYLDSLPAVRDVGRGSPVGMEFYEHHVFPERYRGACFMGDWSLGRIYAVRFQRRGAGFQAEVERFCSGMPMNVTDLAVGPDGAIYFTMGGRGSAGGVYRIVGVPALAGAGGSEDRLKPGLQRETPLESVLHAPQPLAAWSRQVWRAAAAEPGMERELLQAARDQRRPVRQRLRALDGLHVRPGPFPVKEVAALLSDPEAEVRAHVVWLMGLQDSEKAGKELLRCLRDEDPFVRRRV